MRPPRNKNCRKSHEKADNTYESTFRTMDETSNFLHGFHVDDMSHASDQWQQMATGRLIGLTRHTGR